MTIIKNILGAIFALFLAAFFAAVYLFGFVAAMGGGG
jgi:hypothetical protein